MANKTNFGDDLHAIQSTVDLDVAKILSLAKSPQSATNVVEISPTAPQPSTNVNPVSESDNRSKLEHTTKRSSRRTATTQFENAEPQILENVTTRLTRGTNALLSESALRQQLAHQKPDTRQGIVETALVEWFERHGYRAK